MEYEEIQGLTDEQKEFINLLTKEKGNLLSEFNQKVNELENFHKKMSQWIEGIEDSINLDMLSIPKKLGEEVTVQHTNFIEILKNKKTEFLKDFEQTINSLKLAKDNFYKGVIQQVDNIEHSIKNSISSTEEDKYRGFIVQVGRRL
ncbi:MAG: hypothetical protein Q3980_17125 [Turicibacter sp.]|nr:hypothetical protein [Turicibacter sp.]